MRYLKISVFVTTVVLLFGAQVINSARAQSTAPCTMPTLAPEWVAVRQQYERGYRPINAAQQGNKQQLMFVIAPSLAPEWIAVRQQYERGFQLVAPQSASVRRLRFVTVPALAPEWMAVRRQYEPAYRSPNPAC